jgi:hypothetical protein
MKKITKKFLNMLFARYSRPIEQVDEKNCVVGYSHINDFARFYHFPAPNGNAILIATVGKLYSTIPYYISELLKLGFKQIRTSNPPEYYLQVDMPLGEIENWVLLLLSDDMPNVELAYQQAQFIIKPKVFSLGIGKWDKEGALCDMRKACRSFVEQEVPSKKNGAMVKKYLTREEEKLLFEHYVRLYNLQPDIEKMDYLCTLLE